MAIHFGLSDEQRDVLSLFKNIGNRFTGNFATIDVRLSNPHELAKAAKDQLAVSLAQQMFVEYINSEDQTKIVNNETEVKGKTFVEQLKERLDPFRLSNGLFVEGDDREGLINRRLLHQIMGDMPEIEVPLIALTNIQNTILDEIAGTINHFVAFSDHKKGLKEAYRMVLNAASAEFSFIQEGLPIGILLAGEALILENKSLQFEFETFFKNRFHDIEKTYYKELAKVILKEKGIEINALNPAFDPLFEKVFKEKVSLADPGPGLLKIFSSFNEQGGELITEVQRYLQEINAPVEQRDRLSQNMISFLKSLNLPIIGTFSEIDGFFDQAYVHAAQVVREDNDPINNVFNARDINTWDFSVDHFTNLEEQGIIQQNIKAAGALYYIYELGDRLGIFRMTDMLVLMWAQGRLDLNQNSAVANLLYKYYKVREDRISPEERAMVYRMVLNKGDGNLLNRMIPNEDFSMLWQQLLSEVVDYIQKSERHRDFDNLVSPYGIFQSTRNLQYNLTNHMVGKPLMDTQEMYAQLQQCVQILKHEDIVKRLAGGSHNNMWGVIENLSRQEFGVAPNISASRSVAVEGNKIFLWIANFQDNLPISNLGRPTPETVAFRNFLNAAESYILAQGQLEDEGMGKPGMEPAIEAGHDENYMASGRKEVDPFDDWD